MRTTHSESKDGLVDDKAFDDCLPEPASATRFARQFDIPSILPYTCYLLAGIEHSSDWDRIRANPSDRKILTETIWRTARWNVLDAADLRIVLGFRETFIDTEAAIGITYGTNKEEFADVILNSSGECERPHWCSTKIYDIFEKWTGEGRVLENGRTIRISVPDHLLVLELLYESSPSGLICEFCKRTLHANIRGRQRTIWETLSSTVEDLRDSL